MHYHLLQFVFMLLSPVLYGASMPEKLWPGKFDIIGMILIYDRFCSLLLL